MCICIYLYLYMHVLHLFVCLLIHLLISPFALPSAPRRVPGRRGLTFSARGQELLSAPGLPLRFPFSRNSSLLPLLHIFPENIRCIVSHFRASSTRPLSVSSVSFISIRLIGWCTPPTPHPPRECIWTLISAYVILQQLLSFVATFDRLRAPALS